MITLQDRGTDIDQFIAVQTLTFLMVINFKDMLQVTEELLSTYKRFSMFKLSLYIIDGHNKLTDLKLMSKANNMT